MKTLTKCHVCNHCVIGEKTFKNILIGPDKLPGLSRNGHQCACQAGSGPVRECSAVPMEEVRATKRSKFRLSVAENRTRAPGLKGASFFLSQEATSLPRRRSFGSSRKSFLPNLLRLRFPACRGLFSVVFAELSGESVSTGPGQRSVFFTFISSANRTEKRPLRGRG